MPGTMDDCQHLDGIRFHAVDESVLPFDDFTDVWIVIFDNRLPRLWNEASCFERPVIRSTILAAYRDESFAIYS